MLQNILTGPVIRQYAVVIVANLSVLCVGLNLAWPSPVLVKLRNETETVLSRPMSVNEESWVVSIGFLIGTCTNFLNGYFVDLFGRKYCILFAYVPMLTSCLLLTFATEVWMLLVGRAITSLSTGILFTVIPMYASEIASKDVRGSLGTFLQIFSSLGIVTMLSVGPFISYLALNWMVTSIVVVTAIPLLFIPESPYFLHSKGLTDEAVKVLTFLRGSDSVVDEELKEYSVNREENVNKKELFKSTAFLKALGIAIIVGAGVSLIGYNAVTFYLQTVLESTQTNVMPEIASVVIGFIQLGASFCTTFVSDRFGRKPILTCTLAGMALGMLGLGIFFQVSQTSDQSVTGVMNFLPLVSLILVVFCFSSGVGSLNWPLTAELFDGPSRGIGVSITMTFSIFSVFITTRYFAIVTLTIGAAATYFIFCVNCVLLCLFILFCIPETKGKSFSEIQRALGQKDVDGGGDHSKENGDLKF